MSRLVQAGGLDRPTVKQLLTTLERIPGHVVWIFTTTAAGQKLLFDNQIDAGPLVSRCVRLALESDVALPFAHRAQQIAKAEGLDGQPLAHYIELCRKHENNLRAVLQEIEAGAMGE